MIKKQVDICIIGGALNGLLAALILSKLNFKIALIDQNPLQHFEAPPFDGRTTAISYGSAEIIQHHLPEFWSSLKQDAAEIKDIYITHDQEAGCLHYGPTESDHRAMGYIVHNQKFKQLLFQEVKKSPLIDFIFDTTFTEITTTLTSQDIILNNQQQLSCRLLIAADGAHSLLRTRFGLEKRNFAYHQTALTFLTHHAEPHQGRAFEHFLTCGPLAFLPLPDPHQSSVVWSLNTKLANTYKNLSNGELAYHVNGAFQETLGNLTIISSVHHYPLSLTLLKSCVSKRGVLIGDAAHVIHPVAGQGFNLGIRDSAQLYHLFHQAKSLGLDIGSQAILKKYAAQRRFDVLSMSGFTDGIVRLFSNDNRFLKILRSQGLKTVSHINPLKKILARRAMGLSAQF